jgi:uncharacterized protein YbbC (DUF1343 family)
MESISVNKTKHAGTSRKQRHERLERQREMSSLVQIIFTSRMDFIVIQKQILLMAVLQRIWNHKIQILNSNSQTDIARESDFFLWGSFIDVLSGSDYVPLNNEARGGAFG